MSGLIWNFEALVEFTKSEEAEVRFWAVDRLVRHFPLDCCDEIAELLLDDHETTPAVVARHLSEFGGAKHHAILVRGFRLLRGLTPGFCLQALAAQQYPDVVGLASDALQRGDLTQPARALIIGTLADLRTPAAQDLVREYVSKDVEILAEPAALHGVLLVVKAEEIPDTLSQFLLAFQRAGGFRAGEAFRTVMNALHIDDAEWCFRTGPSGHIELRKTIKAVESGYDCDIFKVIGDSTIKQISQRFRSGNRAEVIRAISEWTIETAERIPCEPGNDRPERIAAAVRALSSPAFLGDLERMGRQFEQWVLGFQLSAAFAVARSGESNPTLEQARGDLEQLLVLAEMETAFHLSRLPTEIAAVCINDEAKSHKAQDWCLRMLESQGPFFPRVVAIETLGELSAIHFIPELMEYLAEENSYIYGAAERALSKMGEAIVIPAVARIESGTLDPDAAHSLLVLLCDLGTEAAHDVIIRYLDWFMAAVSPGTTAEWVSLFGTETLIEPLRDWLDEDPALVGHGLLLIGAIHGVTIPEEAEILRAIEDERARLAAQNNEGSGPVVNDDGGSYLM
jgi:hypothetical protein